MEDILVYLASFMLFEVATKKRGIFQTSGLEARIIAVHVLKHSSWTVYVVLHCRLSLRLFRLHLSLPSHLRIIISTRSSRKEKPHITHHKVSFVSWQVCTISIHMLPARAAFLVLAGLGGVVVYHTWMPNC